MTYYTVWYWQDNTKVVWATGLTKEEAEVAFNELLKMGFTAGIEEE